MINKFLTSLCILGILVLSACNASQDQAEQSPPGSDPAGQMETGSGLSVLQLTLGTFKLDQTDTPIDAEEASELLPLWKALRSLSQNDTTAAEELQALIVQIEGTLTSEQVKAVQNMNLSFQDVQSVSQELGLNLGAGGGGVNRSASAQDDAQGTGGGMPAGGGFGGGPEGIMGGGGPPGAGVDAQAMQTAMASSNSGGTSLGVNEAMLGAVIDFLAAKAQ
jgi:hypothetical protein